MQIADMPLRVLIVEDSADDAALFAHELRRAGFNPAWERVETADAMRAALRDKSWDIIISDYVVPGFGGMQALQIAKDSGLEIPFIAISGKVDEETLIDAVKAGACDFLVKGRIGRLPSVIKRELAVAEARRGMHQAEIHWRAAFDAVRDPIVIMDSEDRIERANLAYATLAGMPIQELHGRPYWQVFPKLPAPSARCKAAMDAGVQGEEEIRLPDGRTFLARVFPLRGRGEKNPYFLCVLQDITERDRVRAAIEASERHFRKLIEGGADAFFVMDRAGNVVYRSPSGKQLTGYNDEDVIGRGIAPYVVPEDLPLVKATIAETIRNPGKNTHVEVRMRRKDGTVIEVEATGRNLLADPDVGGIVVTARDITERRLSEKKLRDSEARYRGIFEQAKDVIYMIDAAGTFVALSPSFEKITDWTAAEWLHKPFLPIVHPDDRERAVEIVRQTITQEASSEFEMRIGKKAGGYWTGEFTVSPIEIGGSTILFGIGRDITERKQAQDALNASRDLLGSVVEHAPVRVFWKDAELRYLGCNSLFARDAGMSSPEELLGKNDFQMAWREQAEAYRADDRRVIDSDSPKLGIEEPQTTPDGRTIWLRTSKVPLHGPGGKSIGVLGVYEDVTERKQAEEELKRLNWAMRALSQSNSALVHAATEQELFARCCEGIAGTQGYPLAWIGFACDDPAKTVELVASAGAALHYLDGLPISWAETPEGRGPTGRVIRSGEVQLCNDFAAEPTFLPWREKALAHGLACSISLPIRYDGKVIGALMIYSRETNAFGAAEVKLFEELAGDLSYGIATRRMRTAYDESVVERERSAVRLRKSLEDSIQAIAATVEARDPYTAGHEKRVAELAAAIARELELPALTVEGIHFGALIHDLGKIRVPAEILSKPTRLLPIEYELIKAHSQAGYDILKGIEFPWPIAQMVLQHHERLDGSGYPNRLKGEQIQLEARVLAVADTVEAMSSHRPYRPGLGIEAALAEVEKNSGRLYDDGVVQATLRLFRERGYQIPG